MLRYVPGFILDSSASHADSGSLSGFVLFADIAGFTNVSNDLRKEGKKGAEALNQYLTHALSYPIEMVEKRGGFISHFAGDAFFAVFPDADAAHIKYIVGELTSYFTENHSCQTDIGDYPLQVRIAVSMGTVNWQVFRLPQQAEYVFSGKPFQEIITLSAQKLDVALSPSVQAAFDAVTTKLDIPKQLEFKYDEASERQYLNPKLHGINPDNEIRDAGYCFIDMSWLEKDQILPTLSLIHDKLDDYGGYLNKLDAGDKGLVALVLFGIPKAMGNTLERACRFALETIAEQPNLSIGMSCGNAYAGFVGSKTTREYTALGAAVNLASRLMQEAKKGEILTDSYLEQEMHYKYRFETASSVSLKGFATPVHCNRLIDRLPAPPQSFLAELVGRETEVEQIRQAVQQNGSRIMYISGEPGVGKSRLIIEALKPYPNRYFLFCDPSGHKLLEPIKQFLRQYFAYDPLLSREQNQKNYRERWSELAGDDKELLRIESIIGNLLGFDWEGSIWSMLPPEERPEQQRKAFATLLTRITESERIIIHLDDPQWLDASDIDYLRQLGTAKLDGIVIIAACRYLTDGKAVNLEIPNWEAGQIDLSGLSEEAAVTMIHSLLKLNALPGETQDWIVRKAEGNPLFIEQVVAYLKENDCFDSEYKLKGNLDYLSSFGIADIIGSRIDSLTESVRNTLQHACILGLEFNTRVLSEMLSRKLDDDLGEGKQARVWADIDELRYIFTHVLIKDTAYNRMLSDKLKALHLLAAETMESLYQDEENALNEHAEEIAKHFDEAGEEEKAAEYFDKAGCWYKEHYEWEKSEENLRKALITREMVLGEEHRKTASTLDNLGELFNMRGLNDQAECYYLRSLAILERVIGGNHPDTASVLINLAVSYQEQDKYTQAESLNLRGLQIYEQLLGIEHPETVRSLDSLASLYCTQAKYSEAQSLCQQSLSIREKVLGCEDLMTAISLNNLGNIYEAQGEYESALKMYMRALDIKKRVLGETHLGTATTLNNLAGLYGSMGNDTEAETLYQKALEIREKVLGVEHPKSITAMNNLAASLTSQDKYESAELMYQRAIDIAEKVLGAEHTLVASSLSNLASLYGRQCKYSDAEPLCLRALAIREKLLGAEHPDYAISLNNLAELYKNQNIYEKAEPLYQRSLTIFEKVFGIEHPYTSVPLNNLAGLYESQGKYEQAEQMYLHALEIREKVYGTDHIQTAIALNNLGYLFKQKGSYEQAELYCLRALSILENNLGLNHPHTAIFQYNLAILYMALGTYTKAELLFIKSVSIRVNALGLEHTDTQKTIQGLIETYEKLNQPKKADEYRAMLINSNGSS